MPSACSEAAHSTRGPPLAVRLPQVKPYLRDGRHEQEIERRDDKPEQRPLSDKVGHVGHALQL